MGESETGGAVASVACADERVHGTSLLELLVATACTGLLAAAILPLVVGGGSAAATLERRLAATSLARATLAAVVADVERAGDGLEGSASITFEGTRVPVVAAGGQSLRLLVPDGPTLEVALAGANLFTARPLPQVVVVGMVAALGQPGHPVASPAPAGRVVAIDGLSRLLITWGDEQSSIDAWGVPRALQPLVLREYAVVEGVSVGPLATLSLRRRNGAGPWQPLADGFSSWSMQVLQVSGDVPARLLDLEISMTLGLPGTSETSAGSLKTLRVVRRSVRIGG